MDRVLYLRNTGNVTFQNGGVLFIGSGGERMRQGLEGLEIVMVECAEVSLSASLLVALAENGVPVVFCNGAFSPAGISLPLHGHCFRTDVVSRQLACSAGVKEAIWHHIVRCKIHSQLRLLEEKDLNVRRLLECYGRAVQDDCPLDEYVRCEKAASAFYFDELFGSDFRRRRYGRTPNDYLNYGYTVLRAAVVRELVASGLFVGQGLYHSRPDDDFPLADDVIEPYRAFVDRIVYSMYCLGEEGFDERVRERLVGVLSVQVRVRGFVHPLSEAVRMTADSVKRVLVGDAEISELLYPD